MAAFPDSPADAGQTRRRWWALADVALIFLLFFLHAGWAPPDVNEAHYLAKAKHFWNPDWCGSDHFLESADAHAVFCWTIGWLTLYVSLPAVAWIGRIATWLLLAWGWRRLSFALVERPLFAVLSAALFLCFLSRGHMAGEWIVGGVEAKCLAYALAFFGLAELIQGRWSWTWLLLGAASAFHVLVGGWCVIAAGVAWLCAGEDRPPLLHMVPALIVGGLLAVPGLVSAFLLHGGVRADVVREAAEIYVFERLDHHLLLQKIRWWYIARFLAMTAVWMALFWWLPDNDRRRRLNGFVVGAIYIGILGAVIETVMFGNHPVVALLMRFYWYRLADVAVPIGLALSATVAVVAVEKWARKTTSPGRQVNVYWQRSADVDVPIGLAALAVGTVVGLKEQVRKTVPQGLLVAAIVLAGVSLGESYFRNRWYRTGDSHHINWHKKNLDWREICYWIDGHFAPGERFLTPRLQETFKWYAGRSEVFSWKDVPQDARGIVEWYERYQDIFRTKSEIRGLRWRESLADIDIVTLRELADKYDFRYVIVDRTVSDPQRYPPDVIRVFQNDSFTMFRLREAAKVDDETAPSLRSE